MEEKPVLKKDAILKLMSRLSQLRTESVMPGNDEPAGPIDRNASAMVEKIRSASSGLRPSFGVDIRACNSQLVAACDHIIPQLRGMEELDRETYLRMYETPEEAQREVQSHVIMNLSTQFDASWAEQSRGKRPRR